MRIAYAAIKFSCPDKEIILCGRCHAEVFEQAYNEHLFYKDYLCGFVTEENIFVNRYEAKEIAVAANQLIVPLEDTYAELYSEDLWDID